MRRIAIAITFVLLFSGCNFLPYSSVQVDDLLVAPRLNARQAEVYKALEAIIDPSQILYKYPSSGDYRSPFVFYDLSGDATEEAIVFYAHKNDPGSIRAIILAEKDGRWFSIHDLSGYGDQVEFIDFATLTDDKSKCLIIGWQSSVLAGSTMGVYSFSGGNKKEEILLSYSFYTLKDFDQDGISEIVAVSPKGQSGYNLSLVAQGLGGGIRVLDVIPLVFGASTIYNMQYGKLWDASGAVYIDEAVSGDTYTEVVKVENSTLVSVVGPNGSMSEAYEKTARKYLSSDELCVDFDKNGEIELPITTSMPGQTPDGEPSSVALTNLMQLTQDGFVLSYSAVVNKKLGFLFVMPPAWIDSVTAIAQPETNELQFWRIEDESSLPTAELLRIWVYSTTDYRDKFTQDYTRLAKSGVMEYYGYTPATTTIEPLAITLNDATKLLKLI